MSDALRDALRQGRTRSEQLRLDDIRRRGAVAGMRRLDGQDALARARNERLHAERHRTDEARRRRMPYMV